MKNFFKKLNVRQKITIAALVSSFILFLIINPAVDVAYQAFFRPAAVKNINILEKDREVLVSWDSNTERDISHYLITVDPIKRVEEVGKDKNSILITNLENENNYSLNISAVDNSGKKSAEINTIITPTETTELKIVNKHVTNVDNFLTFTIIRVSILSAALFLLTLWVLKVYYNRVSLFTIFLYPAIVLIPYLILGCSIYFSISLFTNKLIFSLILSAGYSILVYLLLLTANILNAAQFAQLPLEQAAKAAQFIFSLISSYFLFIFIFGANIDIILRIVVIAPFVLYFCYSALWQLKKNTNSASFYVLIKSLSITLIIILAIIILSTWPINYIYTIMAIAVIFYILLSISLEIRSKLNNYIWLEYITLIFLVTFLLVFTSIWGIQGSLI